MGFPDPDPDFEPRDIIGAWRSPVARMLWEHDVAGSNPAAPTRTNKGLRIVRNPFFFKRERVSDQFRLPIAVGWTGE